jgi:hypothetical protein
MGLEGLLTMPLIVMLSVSCLANMAACDTMPTSTST